MPGIQHFSVEDHLLCAQLLNPGVTGEPSILIHGIGGSPSFWTDDQIAPFITLGPCYALSLPGHYPAVFPPAFRRNQLTADLIARVLAEAIRQIVGNQRVTLVGHSTGGFAVLAIAVCAPEQVRRLISISGFVQGRWIGALGACQWLARRRPTWLGQLLFKSGYTAGGLGRISPAVFYQMWRVYIADLATAYRNPHLRTCSDASYPFFAQLNLESISHYFARMPDIDIRARLPHIRSPTLALTGDSDPIVPPAQSRIIAEYVPQAELVTVRGGGHLLCIERPCEYQQVLQDWLNRTA